jgi:hypothetical protein
MHTASIARLRATQARNSIAAIERSSVHDHFIAALNESDNTRGPEHYGTNWEYRVVSQLDTEPDGTNSGKRILTIRRVWPRERYPGSLPDYPVPDDIAMIGHENVRPGGNSKEELRTELMRMERALDKPALILAEWESKIVRRVWPATTSNHEATED